MVLVDTVYQRVLALANKEQRGYITPQEFNLFANQAQLEILDSYIYEIKFFSRTPGNDKEYSDMSNLLEEKLGVFKTSISTSAGVNIALPVNLYKLGSIFSNNLLLEQVNVNELHELRRSPLTTPSATNPVCVFTDNLITTHPGNLGSIDITYIRKPHEVKWGYVVINDKALYDPGKTTNFELHTSEETELVYKILKLSGAAIQKPDIAQFAQGMEQGLQQQEKQ